MSLRFLTEHDVADVLGVKPKTLARWRWQGRGPRFRKFGRKVRYAPEDLDEYLTASRRRSTSDPGPERPAA